MHTTDLISHCDAYLAQRDGTYDFRETRYRAVAQILDDPATFGDCLTPLNDRDTVVDIGACMTEFDYHLRTSLGWKGRYVPIDGAIDGTNLEYWVPPRDYEWVIGIEILEHMHDPRRLASQMMRAATKGVIVTTPNPDVVDVIAIDIDHVTPVSQRDLESWGFEVKPVALFGKPDDSLLAWRFA